MDWIWEELFIFIGTLVVLALLYLFDWWRKKQEKEFYEAGKLDAYLEIDHAEYEKKNEKRRHKWV